MRESRFDLRDRLRLLMLGVGMAAAAISVTAACSDDNNDSSGSGSNTSNIQDVSVTEKDFSYDAPSTVTGGLVRFNVQNNGSEDHMAQIARLNDGVTMQQITAALQSPNPSEALKLVTLEGGSAVIGSGHSVEVLADLRPGMYLYLCFVESSDGVPHLAKGMIKSFEVSPPASAAAVTPPEAKVKIGLADFSFVGGDTISTGKNLVQVTNAGPQPHEMNIFKLATGYTVDQLKKDIASGVEVPPGTPPPFQPAGGINGLSVSHTGWVNLDLPVGNYALICFIPDQNTGVPHAALGMVRALTVK